MENRRSAALYSTASRIVLYDRFNPPTHSALPERILRLLRQVFGAIETPTVIRFAS